MPYNTKQRQAVLRCLEQCPEEALTAGEIAETLRRNQCPIGLATVYRQLERLEQAGTTFQDKQKHDAKPARYAGAVVMALLTTALMAALIVLMVWGFTVDSADAPPFPLLAVIVAIPAVIILGVLLALFQRIKEIQRGEEDDAKNY